ncbi:MAG: hypothetical protein RI842_10990, partial [Schleiferiaceae bacterium]|nr:hypothetical protein [Schleiferiaceae bacterium]
MKKLLTLILAAGFYAMQGQEPLPATNQGPCSPTGVTTNPNNPQNPIPGHADFINWFDWTQSRFIFSVDNDNFTTSSLQSPFYINEGATSHFYVTPENPADNKPENGWELVSFHMGVDKDGDYDAENMGDIYFILYNKYRSLLRVFVAIEQNRDGNLIDIELRFKDKAYKTALFGALDEVQQPLKNFDPFTIASSAQVFDNSPTKRDWNYADFPVNYDPCTCQRVILEDGQSEPTDLGETELLLNVKIVDEAEINLEGTSQGNLNPIVEKDPGKTNGTDQWQDFYGPVKKIGTAIESGKKAYKTFKGFKGDVDKEVSGKSNASDVGTGFDNVAKLLTKEIPALDLVPYASEALAIVDYFVT